VVVFFPVAFGSAPGGVARSGAEGSGECSQLLEVDGLTLLLVWPNQQQRAGKSAHV
jgi:hypothetical protein